MITRMGAGGLCGEGTQMSREALAAAVAALVLALSACGSDNYVHTEIVSVEGTSGGSVLEVTYTHGQSNGRGSRIDVVEEGIEVRLAAFWDQGTQGNDIELRSTETVDLDEPLGDRRITVLVPRPPVEFTCIVDAAPSQRCATFVEPLP